MKIVLHAGVHKTDEDGFLGTLTASERILKKNRIAVPSAAHFRKPLREKLIQMNKAAPSPEEREALLDLLLSNEPEEVERLIISNSNFFGTPKEAIDNDIFYPSALNQLAKFRYLFQEYPFELFLSLRNPATFVPALFEMSKTENPADILSNSDPYALQWSELIGRIRQSIPELPITVWCHEDSPFIWGRISRAMAGFPAEHAMRGDFALFGSLLSEEGLTRFKTYVQKHPNMTQDQLYRTLTAFYDKFADPDKASETLAMPGWSDMLIEDLTEFYEEDVEDIRNIPNVTLISP